MTPFIVAQVFLLLVVGGIVAGLQWERRQPGHFARLLLRGRREPVYQGRRLTEWLEDLDFGERYRPPRADGLPREPSDKYNRAAEAIRQIGPTAVPCLVALIRNPYLHPYLYWELRVERLFTGRRWFDHQVYGLHLNVEQAFEVLGGVAKDAIPPLAEVLATTAASTVAALDDIGESPDDMLCRQQTASTAATALGSISVAALPELTQALGHPEVRVRSAAAAAIDRMGEPGMPAAPALLKCLQDEEPYVRLCTACALGKMRRRLDEAVRVLADLALVDDSVISPSALLELTTLGQEAKAAVPALLKLLESSKPELRGMVELALKAIDPSAAAKAGLQ